MKRITPSLSYACAARILALTAAVAVAPVPVPFAMAASPAWVATWQASPQPVWGSEFLFPTHVPPILQDQTVRSLARVSLGGPRLRVVLSNAYGSQPLIVGKVTAAGTQGDGAVRADRLRAVTFAGRDGVSIPPGASVTSDPVALSVPTRAQLAISIYVPNETMVNTFHWDGRQTSWIAPGDQTSMPTLSNGNGAIVTTTVRVLLTGIQVETEPAARTVVVIGDSITDGATATLDRDSRWPDFLAARFAPRNVAVVNAGISGARLLSDGMGVRALARWDRDVLEQPGVRSVIVMLGINDIAWPGTAFAPQARRPSLDDLTTGYRRLVERAHRHGVRVIGATLTPFEGALPGTPLSNYYDMDKDALRERVNDWIRRSGVFDAVIDFDAALRDPAHPARIDARYDSGDHLHPGDEGNRAMAEYVDLDAVAPGRDSLRGLIPNPIRHPIPNP
ncbi:SGNH/GDSL hydrolase family protein [Pararobbsia silviterrae]|uniref:SGNH/GDSL hydrolase family protein n=1 Tax=Pararobbsia silviterrae TaxID=1792498 RepID=A0A494Y325_9BURK|nr:SGNH/GDSL hydrolase family protein [Pararobbsia silviterrae]RKP54887.1 SGNH/GDSL hydrolase family protein [Pararobbsia silviterrae]